MSRRRDASGVDGAGVPRCWPAPCPAPPPRPPPRPVRRAATSDGQAPAGPGPYAWEVQPLTLEVMTGPDADLPVTIDADVWVPEVASPSSPAPAVLTTHGFGNTKDAAEQLANSAYFASHGYVVLSYTSMGFGGSSSCIGLDSLDYDVPVARAGIDHLASRADVALDAPGDPKVGMIGGSYGGGLQGLVAAVDHRMDAIAIGRSWNTLQYSLDPNNWIPDGADPWDLDATDQGVFKQGWTSLFFALGATQPANGAGGCDPVTQQEEFPGTTPCPGFVPAICPTFEHLSTTGDATDADRALVGRSSVATVLEDLDAPTLLLQGLPDTLFTPTEAAATYRTLRDRGVPTAMIWDSGGHGGYQTGPGEAEAYGGQWDDTPDSQAEFADGYLPRRTLQWFERHVRGRRVDTGPAFSWFRAHLDGELDASGSAAPAYGTATDFPVPTAATTRLVLDPAGGALLPEDAELTGSSAQMVTPPGGEPATYTELPNFSSPGQPGDQPVTDPPGQALTFTAAPVDAPTEVVGVPRAARAAGPHGPGRPAGVRPARGRRAGRHRDDHPPSGRRRPGPDVRARCRRRRAAHARRRLAAGHGSRPAPGPGLDGPGLRQCPPLRRGDRVVGPLRPERADPRPARRRGPACPARPAHGAAGARPRPASCACPGRAAAHHRRDDPGPPRRRDAPAGAAPTAPRGVSRARRPGRR